MLRACLCAVSRAIDGDRPDRSLGARVAGLTAAKRPHRGARAAPGWRPCEGASSSTGGCTRS